MCSAIILLLTPLAACHAADIAEIVEEAEGAARVVVSETSPLAGTAIEGLEIRARVVEPLWGDPPLELLVWTPRSACGDACKGPELVIGYRWPTPAQRAHLGLPAGVSIACGSQVHREGLCRGLKRLRSAKDSEALLALLREGEPAVRRQAFRQLAHSFLAASNSPLLGELVPIAERETDPELLGSYLSAFGHFRFEGASVLVTEMLIETESDIVSGEAERTFKRVARPESVARLVAAYRGARLPVKGRILRALAPVELPDAQELLESAIREEETAIPALDAIIQAGKLVRAGVPRVRDPLRAQRMRSILKRANIAPPGETGPWPARPDA